MLKLPVTFDLVYHLLLPKLSQMLGIEPLTWRLTDVDVPHQAEQLSNGTGTRHASTSPYNEFVSG